VTGMLGTLIKRGLVRGEPHPTDRRMVLVHLTKSGTRMVDKVRNTVHRREAEWMRSLNENERAHLTELLGKIQKNLAP
jgi:DNA-binding MarR family transcriptional regulator